MKMMIEAGGSFTRASLRETIIKRFGEDTRFYTCSADTMTADELIDFLAARGKFIDDGGGFNTQPDRICKH